MLPAQPNKRADRSLSSACLAPNPRCCTEEEAAFAGKLVTLEYGTAASEQPLHRLRRSLEGYGSKKKPRFGERASELATARLATRLAKYSVRLSTSAKLLLNKRTRRFRTNKHCESLTLDFR
jgi:hypothetical protein